MEYSQLYKNENAELKISDYSSEEENINTRGNHNSSALSELAAIEITWSSDDELGTENCQSLLNRSFIGRGAMIPVSRKCYSSARKSKLRNLCVKRKLNKTIESVPEVRTTLGTRNVHSNLSHDTNSSPWCKVRRTFSTLRYRSSLPTIDTYAGQNENAENRETLNHFSPQKSEGTSIEWSSSSSESGSPNRPTQNSALSTQKSTAPTELELLVALIERENAAAKTTARPNTVNQKKKSKRCVQGGYVERLQKLEEAARIERNFLENDQKLGLQSGTQMCVLQLNEVYGVHIATVRLEQTDETLASDEVTTTVRIIVDADMAAHIRVGSRIEAFIDFNIKPYTIVPKGDTASKEVIYVQPHKLLLL